MIGRLAGRIVHLGEDHLVLDVAGVGYMVHVSDRVRATLPGVGEAVALWTDLLVREDLLQLFGFQTLQEKEWHRLLMTVQGVGAKAALAIQGVLGPDGLSRALALGDWGAIAKAKGVGPKTAQRVVMELKDKAPAVMALGGSQPPPPPATGRDEAADVVETPAPPVAASAPGAEAEALSALQNLGYPPSEAASAIATAAGEGAGDTAALIRAALKYLAPS